MTISKRGSAPMVVLMLGAVTLIVLVGLLANYKQTKKAITKGVILNKELLAAHSISALVKQELNDNFLNFQTDAAWAACRSTGNLANFLTILDDPAVGTGTNPNGASNPLTCPAVNFTLTYMTTAAGGASFPVSQFKTSRIVPKEPISTLQVIFAPREIINNARFIIIGEITSESAANTQANNPNRELANFRAVRAMINVERTVAAPSGDMTCHLCRATPGSVCCAGIIRLTYLDSAGMLFDLEFIEKDSTLSVTPSSEPPNSSAVTIKNLTTTRTDYGPSSFCIPAIQPDPISYIIDAAQSGGVNYYLTSSGTILREATAIVTLPTLSSIAFDEFTGVWYFLRTDGTFLRTSNIDDSSTYRLIAGLSRPTAEKIATGSGPAISPPCW